METPNPMKFPAEWTRIITEKKSLSMQQQLHQESPQQTLEYKNLVFEGGGVKGIAYCGALDVLKEGDLLKNFNSFAGSSVGSIIAGLLAIRASSDFILEKMQSLDFNQFKDDSWGILKDLYRLLWKFGWHCGDKLYNYYGDIVKEITGNADITLSEIHQKYGTELILTITKVYKSGGETVYVSRHNYPNLSLRLAVRMSSSFPYFFESLFLDGIRTTDGGLLDNYPIGQFDRVENGRRIINQETLGLRLESSSESQLKAKEPLYDVKDFSFAILGALYNQAGRVHVSKNDWSRTININTGNVSSMDLGIDEETKKFLYSSGRDAMNKFLKQKEII